MGDTGTSIAFRILGPIEFEAGGEPVPLSRRARHLLAVLALNRGRVVPVPRLYQLLWEHDPAGSARAGLRVHVARLRRLLRDHRAGETGVEITSCHGGYALLAGPSTVDADRFRQLLRQAGGARPEQRMRLLGAALALWRDPVLDGPLDNRLYGELLQLRVLAQEDWAATGLAVGRHHELLPELARLIELDPTRERLAELRILALLGLGRRAEALDAFRCARAVLREQLGLEPGRALQAAQRLVLDTTVRARPVLVADFGGV